MVLRMAEVRQQVRHQGAMHLVRLLSQHGQRFEQMRCSFLGFSPEVVLEAGRRVLFLHISDLATVY